MTPTTRGVLLTYAWVFLVGNLVWEVVQLPFYTLFREWFNVTVRGSWTYAPAMPRLPPLGTGLAPLLQWLAVPSVAFALARRKALNASCKRDGCREDVPRG